MKSFLGLAIVPLMLFGQFPVYALSGSSSAGSVIAQSVPDEEQSQIYTEDWPRGCFGCVNPDAIGQPVPVSYEERAQGLMERSLEINRTLSNPEVRLGNLVRLAEYAGVSGVESSMVELRSEALAIALSFDEPQRRAEALTVLVSPRWLDGGAVGLRQTVIDELVLLVPRLALEDKNSLLATIAVQQARQGQLENFNRTLAQGAIDDRAALTAYAEWGAEAENIEGAIAQIEGAGELSVAMETPLRGGTAEFWQPVLGLSVDNRVASDRLTVRRLNLLFWLFSTSAGGLGANEQGKLRQAQILPHIEKQFAKLQNSDLELEYRAHFIHRMNVVDFSVISEQYRQVLRGVERSSRSVLERVGLLNYLLKYSISREILADDVKESSDRVIASLFTELLNDGDTENRTKVEALQELMLVWVQPEAVRLGQVERVSRLIEGLGSEWQRAQAWVRTGQLYERLYATERAIGAVDRAVALVGALKTDEDLMALVEVLGQLDQDEKILKIAEETGNSRVLEKLAEIYASEGRVEEAMALQKRVAEPDIKISMIQNLIVYHQMTGLSVFSAEELEALSLEAIGLVNGASGGQEFSVPIELPWASRVRLVNSFSSLEQQYAQYVRLQPTSAEEEEEQWQGVMRLWARVTPETRDANLYYALDNAVDDSNPDRLERVLAQIEDPAEKADAMIDAIWLLEILIRNQRAFEGY
jgi:hypothetical protein